MTQNRRKAPSGIRRRIAESLRDENYRIYPDGQRYLDLHELVAEGVVADLLEEIERFEIFILPPSNPGGRQKYDYVIRYDDPELLVYVKMSPTDGEPPFVYLTFHSHNIPGPSLPRIPIQEQDNEDT